MFEVTLLQPIGQIASQLSQVALVYYKYSALKWNFSG